jgi:phosphatidylserine/phosphatidylglycerophosphate/cardiolipin synthase-like enzyme
MDNLIKYLTDNFGRPFSNETEAEVARIISRLNRPELIGLRKRLFQEAQKLERPNNGKLVLSWLQHGFELIDRHMFRMHRVFFSPGTEILESISEMLKETRETIDLCVFTITDERLVSDIRSCHERGVKVRLITDDDKMYDLGSAIKELKNAGIPVKTDHSRYHMHHKFGIIDTRIVFTGSFNWTYTASKHNQENLLITSNFELVKQYAEQYEMLWDEMFRL